VNTKLLACAHFASNVDFRGGIVAGKHCRQAWPNSLRSELLYLSGNFVFDLCGDLVSVEDGSQRDVSLRMRAETSLNESQVRAVVKAAGQKVVLRSAWLYRST